MISKDPETQSQGAMFVPIILGSDKTTVSVATGNNEYWPIYLSIGNIHNTTRRAHRNGLVLLGFFAIPKCSFTPHISFLTFSFHFQPKNNMPIAASFANFVGSSPTRPSR